MVVGKVGEEEKRDKDLEIDVLVGGVVFLFKFFKFVDFFDYFFIFIGFVGVVVYGCVLFVFFLFFGKFFDGFGVNVNNFVKMVDIVG